MKRPGEHWTFSVACPNCAAPIEHSLAWLKGRSRFDFYCDSCGHREDIEIATVVGLADALREDFTEPETT